VAGGAVKEMVSGSVEETIFVGGENFPAFFRLAVQR
jgi:hypothetical protein